MVLEKNTIIYFSGTGNSLQVAKDISNELGGLNLCPIASFAADERIKVEAETLGIVFPVYYARLPLIVEMIVKRLEVKKDTYVFAVATYGGGPAEVLVKMNNVLQSNGINLNSGFLLRMPANHIFAYNPGSIKKYIKVLEREKKKVEEISDIIRERKNCKCESSKLVIDVVIDRLFSKATDRIMDNFRFRDEKFWVNHNCNGCRVCERICPVNNIEFNSNKPVWKHNCEQCTACIQYCPKEAIQWGKKTVKRKRYRNPNISMAELIVK